MSIDRDLITTILGIIGILTTAIGFTTWLWSMKVKTDDHSKRLDGIEERIQELSSKSEAESKLAQSSLSEIKERLSSVETMIKMIYESIKK